MKQEQPAQITSVHLKGYKSIRDLSVDLKQGLNIIIGANGSGKTNFMEFLNAAYELNYGQLLNGQNKRFECEVIANNTTLKLKGERVFQSKFKNVSYQVEELILVNDEKRQVVHFLDQNKKVVAEEEIEANFFLYDFINHFETLFLQFENPLNKIFKEKLALNLSCGIGDVLINSQYEQRNFFNSELESDNGFYSFLNTIFFKTDKVINNNKRLATIINEIVEDEWFSVEALQMNLKQFSSIKNVRIDWELTRRTIQDDNDDGETGSITSFNFLFFINDEWINWNQLSDGTKRLVYLIGSVTYATENTIILIEEPELGIHPHQLSTLMNFLKFQSAEKQIILTTHSPQVLNCLKATELDRIIVARHEGKTGTQMYHLSEEEQGFAVQYMKNEAFLSDYWLLSGFMNEETV